MYLLNFVMHYSKSKCIHSKVENFESKFFFIPFVVLEMGKILYHQNKEESSSFSQSSKKPCKFCIFELFIIVFMIKWEISNQITPISSIFLYSIRRFGNGKNFVSSEQRRIDPLLSPNLLRNLINFVIQYSYSCL